MLLLPPPLTLLNAVRAAAAAVAVVVAAAGKAASSVDGSPRQAFPLVCVGQPERRDIGEGANLKVYGTGRSSLPF